MKVTTLDLTNGSQNNISVKVQSNIIAHDIDGAENVTPYKIPTNDVWMKAVPIPEENRL